MILDRVSVIAAMAKKNITIAELSSLSTAEVLLRGLDQGDLDYREGMHPPVVEPVPVLEHRAVC